MPRVAVIVPAYNASVTLAAALSSLQAQTLTDWEVVVVDDGSTDSTAAIARSFAEADSRIRLLSHSSNRGAAAAHNTALAATHAPWVTRLDADDTLPPQALALMMAQAADDVDIVWGRGSTTPVPSTASLNDLPICIDSFALWGKALRRELLMANPMWEPLDRWDDLSVLARVFARRPRVAFVSQIVYNYTVAPRGKSLSTASVERVISDHIAIATRLDEWFRAEGLAEEYAPFLNHLKFAAKVKLLRHKPRRPLLWQRTFPEVNNRIMGLRHVALRYRLLFAAAALLPSKLLKK